jgi:hypothetical protein
VGGDVSIDSETSVVTSSISKPSESLEDTHRGKVCVRVFIEMCS